MEGDKNRMNYVTDNIESGGIDCGAYEKILILMNISFSNAFSSLCVM